MPCQFGREPSTCGATKTLVCQSRPSCPGATIFRPPVVPSLNCHWGPGLLMSPTRQTARADAKTSHPSCPIAFASVCPSANFAKQHRVVDKTPHLTRGPLCLANSRNWEGDPCFGLVKLQREAKTRRAILRAKPMRSCREIPGGGVKFGLISLKALFGAHLCVYIFVG